MTPRKCGRPQKSEYLTTTEAAAWMTAHGRRMVARTVARRCDDGTIACVWIMGDVRRERRILQTELEKFLVKPMDKDL